MHWRLPLFRQRRKASDAADAIRELMMGDNALYNRAALNPETLRLYHGMILDSRDARLMGVRFVRLVNRFARERGVPPPVHSSTMLAFLDGELRDFHTPEATERRRREVIEEMKRVMRI